jgi:hypothetical protein
MLRENVIRAEKGRVNLTVETLMRFADGLGVDLAVGFVGAEGDAKKPRRKAATSTKPTR